MTNQDILRAAMQQSAIDMSCSADDFLLSSPQVVLSMQNDSARKYLTLPFDMQFATYGNNVVASVQPPFRQIAQDYLRCFDAAHAFETPGILALDDRLKPLGLRICYMAEYFLPDLSLMHQLPCAYEERLLVQADFAPLYTPEWSNALCAQRAALDVLGVGAYDQGRLIGLAACSMDCDSMWQIGVDVLPAYRRQGVASALTSRLALEILSRGKIPFYCAAWCNLRSVRNALRCGFRPSWAEMTARPADFVAQMNRAFTA